MMKQNTEHQAAFQTVFATRRKMPTSNAELKPRAAKGEAKPAPQRSERETLHLPERHLSALARS